MIEAEKPRNEPERMAALRACAILDSTPEEGFERIVRIARQLSDAPIALITFVDEARQWFKASIGLEAKETPRRDAFCAHAILDAEITWIEDAHQDLRFHDNPLVSAAPFIRFYAGAPIIIDGLSLGTVCVIDKKPRAYDASLAEGLRELAGMAQDQIRLRLALEAKSKALQEAAAANRAKSYFLSSMSHELRTPLNAILGFSEIMANEMFGPFHEPRYREYATDINNAGSHLLSLVNDILDLSKIEAGKTILLEDHVDLLELIGDAGELALPASAASPHPLECALAPNVLQLNVDARAMKQVFVNLFANAAKYSPPGAAVQVLVENRQGALRIAIKDQGIGMKPDDIPLALTAFGQIAGPSDLSQHGTGLGLPIAKSLIECHGGALSIESEPGVGTTIIIDLPAERVLWREQLDRSYA